MTNAQDLFDDSTMTFGEHLEVLRMHLIRALLGVAICVIVALCYGDRIVAFVRAPIDKALRLYDITPVEDVEGTSGVFSWEWWKRQSGIDVITQVDPGEKRRAEIQSINTGDANDRTIEVKLRPSDLANVLHAADPQRYPKVTPKSDESVVTLPMAAPEFHELERVVDRTSKPITLNVQEAFMMYVKVATVAGLIVASPWVIYQLWLFVAAGLYPHEKRYVRTYLPISVILFLAGCSFCFYCVFPFMLNFLLGFNKMLGLQPQIRISEWISFALLLPLVFGVSFELPLVMLFLERISIFNVQAYREKRRLAILILSFLSMMLTPSADPMSMILMLLPMIALYELGIWMCRRHNDKPLADVPAIT